MKKVLLFIILTYFATNEITILAQYKPNIVKDSIYKNTFNLAIKDILISNNKINVVADILILNELPDLLDTIKIIKYNLLNFNNKVIPTKEAYIVINPVLFDFEKYFSINIKMYKYFEYDSLYREWYIYKECKFEFMIDKSKLIFKEDFSYCIETSDPPIFIIDDRGNEILDSIK